MKKLKLLLFVFVLIPVILLAASKETYSSATNRANDLMNTGYYKNTSSQYILKSYGGEKLIDRNDYEGTVYNGSSYLSDGVEFWTKSDCDGGKCVVTSSGALVGESVSASYNTKAAVYVKPETPVTGRGTWDSPWMFEPMYKVELIGAPSDTYNMGVTELYVSKNSRGVFEGITPKDNNRYITNDCDGTYDSNTGKFTTGTITGNTTCKLTFGTGRFTITLNKATPSKIYLSYRDDYYSDTERTRPIREITRVEPRAGYIFAGYFYGSNMVVNGNNKIQRGTAGSIAMDVTLEPSYDIDPPKKDEIVISGGTNRVYNSPDTVELTCTLNKEYDSNTEVYYEFGYASDMTAFNAGTINWSGTASTSNKYTVSRTIPRGTRYYTCRVQAKDKDDPVNNATDWIVSTGTTTMVTVNARIDFDVTTNGGTLNTGISKTMYTAYEDNRVYTTRTGTTTTNIPVKANVSKTGYTLKGWYTEATNGTQVIDNNKNIKASAGNWTTADSKFKLKGYSNTENTNRLYAQFTANTYAIAYNKNNGTGTTASTTCTYDQNCTVASNSFTRDGYAFNKWNTKADGTGTSYNAGATVKNLTSEENGTVNLYALWNDTKPPTPTITSTSTLKSATQTATLKCSDNEKVASYYWGTSAPTSSSTYTSLATAVKDMTETKTVNASGTYYLACKDTSGNVSTNATFVYYKYTVNNMLETETGEWLVYTNANFSQASSASYIAPKGTTLTLTGIYTVPTYSRAGRFRGGSSGVAGTSAASPSTSDNPTLSSNNQVYSMWFTRNRIHIKYQVQSGESFAAGTYRSSEFSWSLDSNSYVKRKQLSNNEEKTELHTIRYVSGNFDLDLFNNKNSGYFAIYKSGYAPKAGSEWMCVSGCKTSGQKFSQDTFNTSFANLCPTDLIKTSDCNIVLKVNWASDTSIDTPELALNDGSQSDKIKYSIKCSDTNGIIGYYLGTSNPATTTVTYTSVPMDTTYSKVIDKSVTGTSVTYYLACKDVASNTKSTSLTLTYDRNAVCGTEKYNYHDCNNCSCGNTCACGTNECKNGCKTYSCPSNTYDIGGGCRKKGDVSLTSNCSISNGHCGVTGEQLSNGNYQCYCLDTYDKVCTAWYWKDCYNCSCGSNCACGTSNCYDTRNKECWH